MFIPERGISLNASAHIRATNLRLVYCVQMDPDLNYRTHLDRTHPVSVPCSSNKENALHCVCTIQCGLSLTSHLHMGEADVLPTTDRSEDRRESDVVPTLAVVDCSTCLFSPRYSHRWQPNLNRHWSTIRSSREIPSSDRSSSCRLCKITVQRHVDRFEVLTIETLCNPRERDRAH